MEEITRLRIYEDDGGSPCDGGGWAYRLEVPELDADLDVQWREETGSIDTLQDLQEVLVMAQRMGWDGEGVDMTSLPTFGGQAPRDTQGVYSWDTQGVLICEQGWAIAEREGAE